MLMLADTFTELWFTPVFLLSCSFQIVKCLSTIERYSPEFPCYIHPQYLVFLFRKKEIFLCSLPDCEILGLYFRIYIYCIRCAKNRSIYRQMVASLSQRPFVVHIIIRSGDFTKTVDAKREVCAQGFKNVCQNALYPFHLLERPIDSISHLHIRGYKSEEYASCQILITQHLRNHLARLPSSPHCPNGCSFKHQFSSVQFSQGKLWSSPFEYSELYRCYALRLRTHLFQVQFRQSRLKETSSHPDDEVLRVANVRDSNQGCERNCQKPTDSLLFIALPRTYSISVAVQNLFRQDHVLHRLQVPRPSVPYVYHPATKAVPRPCLCKLFLIVLMSRLFGLTPNKPFLTLKASTG